MIYKIWYYTPNFLKINIKYFFLRKKYKQNFNLKTIDNFTLDYILSWNLIISKNVNLWVNNNFWWNIFIWDYSYINWPWSNIRWDMLSKISIWKFCCISFGVTILSWLTTII